MRDYPLTVELEFSLVCDERQRGSLINTVA